ncbi:hypothetical protein EGT07_15695 [Herbaspirillum sp. HC18]|nr:hypothetical protein EGT07_15695 [Herbaspirillum sp. HC18]
MLADVAAGMFSLPARAFPALDSHCSFPYPANCARLDFARMTRRKKQITHAIFIENLSNLVWLFLQF